MKKRELVLSGAVFIIVSLVGILVLEFYCRHLAINDNPWISVNHKRVPAFQLKESVPWSSNSKIGVRSGGTARGNRKQKIAVVGDSVTYCMGIGTPSCFVDLMQNGQGKADVYNFGVPGYGVTEIKQVLGEVERAEKFETVVYVYNVNDVYDAMPVLLTLAVNPKTRFASIYEYLPGWGARAKSLLLDYFKLPFVLFYYAAARMPELPSSQAPVVPSVAPSEPPVTPAASSTVAVPPAPALSCFEERKKHALASWAFNRTWPAVKRMYSDPKIQNKLTAEIAAMRGIVEANGGRFVVVPFFDFAFLIEDSREVHNNLISAVKKSGAEVLDLYPQFAKAGEECSFYLPDLAHFDAPGSKRFADWILAYLERTP